MLRFFRRDSIIYFSLHCAIVGKMDAVFLVLLIVTFANTVLACFVLSTLR